MNFFIDSHAHLNDPAFDTDRDSLLQHTLPQAGIVHSIEIGCSPEEWLPALQLASSYPALVHAVLGVHPEYAVKLGENDLARLAQLQPWGKLAWTIPVWTSAPKIYSKKPFSKCWS